MSIMNRSYNKPWLHGSKYNSNYSDLTENVPELKPLKKPAPRCNIPNRKLFEHSNPPRKLQISVEPTEKFFIRKELERKAASVQKNMIKSKEFLRACNPRDPLNPEWVNNFRIHRANVKNARPAILTFEPHKITEKKISPHYVYKSRLLSAKRRQRFVSYRNIEDENLNHRAKLNEIYTGIKTRTKMSNEMSLKLKNSKEKSRIEKLRKIQEENLELVQRIRNIKPLITTFIKYEKLTKLTQKISKFPHFWKLNRPLSAHEKLELADSMCDPNPYVFFDFNAGDVKMGRVIMRLSSIHSPKACENFRSLCVGHRGIGYKGTDVSKIYPGFCFELGDLNGTWAGKMGIPNAFDELFPQESFELVHDRGGIVSMRAYEGGMVGSMFLITERAVPSFDCVHQPIGCVVRGMNVMHKMKQFWKERRWTVNVWVSNCGQLFGNDNLGWLEISCHDDVVPWRCPSRLFTVSEEDLVKWGNDGYEAGCFFQESGQRRRGSTRSTAIKPGTSKSCTSDKEELRVQSSLNNVSTRACSTRSISSAPPRPIKAAEIACAGGDQKRMFSTEQQQKFIEMILDEQKMEERAMREHPSEWLESFEHDIRCGQGDGPDGSAKKKMAEDDPEIPEDDFHSSSTDTEVPEDLTCYEYDSDDFLQSSDSEHSDDDVSEKKKDSSDVSISNGSFHDDTDNDYYSSDFVSDSEQ